MSQPTMKQLTEREEKSKEALIVILKDLTAKGYTCYTTTRGNWGFIITPNDNVLYIQPEYFGGYTFSLQYRQSRECGTGCQCLEQPVDSVTVETVIRAEQAGLQFAAKLRAPLYGSSKEWMQKYWSKETLELIK